MSSAGTMASPAGTTAPAYVRIEDGTSTQLAKVNAQGALLGTVVDATSGVAAKVSADGALLSSLHDPVSGFTAAVSSVGAVSVSASGDTATNADGIATRSTANVAQSLAIALGFNGTTFDRRRMMSAVGDGLGTMHAAQPSSAYQFSAGTNVSVGVTLAAVAGQQHRLTVASANYTGTVTAAANATMQDNGGNIYAWLGSTVPYGMPLPAGGMKQAAVNTTMSLVLGAGGAGAVGNVIMAKLTA
jgi:hypothetical protein